MITITKDSLCLSVEDALNVDALPPLSVSSEQNFLLDKPTMFNAVTGSIEYLPLSSTERSRLSLGCPSSGDMHPGSPIMLRFAQNIEQFSKSIAMRVGLKCAQSGDFFDKKAFLDRTEPVLGFLKTTRCIDAESILGIFGIVARAAKDAIHKGGSEEAGHLVDRSALKRKGGPIECEIPCKVMRVSKEIADESME